VQAFINNPGATLLLALPEIASVHDSVARNMAGSPPFPVMLPFNQWPLWINLAVFAASAAVVWAAGTRLAAYVDAIAKRTGLGQGFAGLLLLGGITSLPEVATVTTSSLTGNPALALNNILGSAAINVVLLAVADAVLGRDALTAVVAKPATLLQGTLGMILLAMTAAAITTGDRVLFGGVGLWSTALLAGCIGALWLCSGYEQRHVWTVVGVRRDTDEPHGERNEQQPWGSLTLGTLGVGAAILAAGYLLSQTGDAIAEQSGLGQGLIGLVLVGFATSLPELSSVTAALRLKRYEMAVGDIFGTNLFNIALIFLADLAYRGERPVLAMAGPFESVASLLAVALTGVFVVGLLERKDKTVMRMGYDSLSAIALFIAGLILLYRIAPAGS
jgi:cation:H+ antiporter